MSARPIPEATRRAQAAASDPNVSAWVAANAGAGKTHVLAQRAIRLLLAAVPPARILCLTFTKAAAAHMANQILNTLREWVLLNDSELDGRLAAIEAPTKSTAARAVARRLFATAIETPGGLKVQTIHAFCDRVLHQFPFEARVPAGFEVLEETGESELLKRVQNGVLLDAAAEPESELGRAFAVAIGAAGDRSLGEVFDEAVRARRHLRPLLRPGGLDRAKAEIATILGVGADEAVAAVDAEIMNGATLPRREWAAVAAALQAMDGNARACGDRLAEAAGAEGEAAQSRYVALFFTAEGGPRSDGQFGSAALRDRNAALFLRLFEERARLVPLLERRRAVAALERTHALNVIACAMIERYEQAKRARGALDYDDLIDKTADLLSDHDAAWVHYKLDGGIDHILIDEAQDTSPQQWKIVEKLAQEFFAGRGAGPDRDRTIFAVGDEKQSIYAFQGADPAGFNRMRKLFHQRASAARQKLLPTRLDLSFRSAPGIVAAVDAIFARPEAFRGLSKDADETRTAHTALRAGPARIEIWDAVSPTGEPEDELAWDAPLNAQSEASAPALLAQRIAKAAKRWLAGGIAVADSKTERPRAPNAGEIIILVRQRGTLFEAILRALKNEGLPVAGADRLILSEHIAVMDIAALGDALLLEADDLALACALKSPLLGFDDDDLFQLAHGRTGGLADALVHTARGEGRFAAAHERITRWRAEARSLRPFDFLSRLLGRDGGREQILGRLGPEAADALDELLSLALAYEAIEAPSLQGFLAFLRRSGSEVKRDLEVASAAIRVMTVHGAKGLEAPIVVLAETTFVPEGRNDPWLLPVVRGSEEPTALLWGLADREDCAALRRSRQVARGADEEEHRRLLYVALTRARDVLIICGCKNKLQQRSDLRENCWYRLVRDALGPELRPAEAGYGFDGVWHWRPEDGAKSGGKAAAAQPELILLPGWIGTAVPPPATRSDPPVSLRPASQARIKASAGAGIDPRRRGILVHRLLQALPDLPAGARKRHAARFLSRDAADLPEAARDEIAAAALAVLEHPDFAVLLSPAARAEVEILGRIDGGCDHELRRIDRLLVGEHEILFADYKTDAEAPAHPQAAPEEYILQLARYRALLARALPGRVMRAFLVWTAGPAIQEIPAALLDATLGRLTRL